MMATKRDLLKAQEIERSVKQEMKNRNEKRQMLKSKISDLRHQVDRNKQQARQKTMESADSNKTQTEAINDVRKAAKLASETNELKHKIKDTEKQLERFKRDADFSLKQKAEKIRKLKT